MGLIARIKGEEPNIFQKVPHRLKGKGHYGEYLAEFALGHGKLGEIATFSNVLVPRIGAVTSASEVDILMLHPTGIFELRCKAASDIVRLLHFFYEGKLVVVTNGFVKKTKKTPAREIALAKNRRKDYLARKES